MTTLTQISSNLTNLKETYQPTTFVETGCYKGEGLTFASNLDFEHLYSCDINQKCVDNCLSMFPDSIIHNTDSITYFSKILPTINDKSLFWLDAHFPAYYGLPETTETKFPMIEELLLIRQLKHNYQNDVILCDDIRVLLPENNSCYNSDIWKMFQVNHTVKELTTVLEDTHNFELLNIGEGVLLFTPK